jgi:hypothetical protein
MMCQWAMGKNVNDGAVYYNLCGSFVDKSGQVYTVKANVDMFEKNTSATTRLAKVLFAFLSSAALLNLKRRAEGCLAFVGIISDWCCNECYYRYPLSTFIN